jgi:hypothetical protein
MKISRPKRIDSSSASKDSREAIETVGISTNSFMNEVYIAIMGNLNVDDNLNMSFATVDVNVDGSGNLNRAVRFKSGIVGRTLGMICIRVSQATPTNQPFATFIENSGVIELTNVTGLAADTDYKLIFLLIGG